VLNFAAANAQLIGPAVSYGIGQGGTMISAIWGIWVWREFENAPRQTYYLLTLLFLFFIAGLGIIAVAPLY
jgi:glucose uptake protein